MAYEFLILKEHWYNDGGCGQTEIKVAAKDDMYWNQWNAAVEKCVYRSDKLYVPKSSLKKSLQSAKRNDDGTVQLHPVSNDPIMELIDFEMTLEKYPLFINFIKDTYKYIIDDSKQGYNVTRIFRDKGFFISFETFDEFMTFVRRHLQCHILFMNGDYEDEEGNLLDTILV